MALAGNWQTAHFNRPGFEMFDYDVYVICSDGDLMEGVSHEAASVAGHQRLHNLCWIYDNNHISIDGDTALAYSDDVAARFMGYGWNVMRVGDANDLDLIDRAFARFREEDDRPTLIVLDSHIGWGSPKQDTAAVHGEPLGEDAAVRPSASMTGLKSPSSWFPTAYESTSPKASGRAGASSGRSGSDCSTAITASTRASPTKSGLCNVVSSPRAGTRTFPRSTQTRMGPPPARHPMRS
jgi:transketolase